MKLSAPAVKLAPVLLFEKKTSSPTSLIDPCKMLPGPVPPRTVTATTVGPWMAGSFIIKTGALLASIVPAVVDPMASLTPLSVIVTASTSPRLREPPPEITRLLPE